jgi:hypothetical protein
VTEGANSTRVQRAMAGPGQSVMESPSGLYSLAYPADWSAHVDGNIANFLPDDTAALTASGFVGRMTPEAVHAAFLRSQPHAEALTGAVATSGLGWMGLRQSFVDRSGEQPVLLDVLMACGEHGFVLLTWNEPMNPQLPSEDAAYLPVFRSLVLAQPRES